jgi:dTDP-4-amino-4,6-dideoxygalactose transaminase
MKLETDATPAYSIPFPAWPHYDEDEVSSVVETLRSGHVNYWTGEQGRLFESEYAAYLGRRHAIALANGTVALELALHALGVGAGDEVITTSRTFIASASCAVMRGATPVMVDVSPESQNMTLASISRAVTPKTKAIIAVHLAGWPCEMDEIMAFATEHDIKVIEDCAQAHGATYKGRPVGSIGHAAAFSFCQDKIMTTGGEGGLFVTNDTAAWEIAWAYKDHGKSYDAVYNRRHPPGFRWFHESFGTNWRMTELQAAIGRLQLKKLHMWVERRQRNAGILTEGFSTIPGIRVTRPPQHIGHAYYKYYVFVDLQALRKDWSRDRIMQAVNEAGIPCFSGSCSEIYLEKAFDGVPSRPVARFESAQHLGETSLMFLVHPTLDESWMRETLRVMAKVMQKATNGLE